MPKSKREPIWAVPPPFSTCQAFSNGDKQKTCAKPASYIVKHGVNGAGYLMCLEHATAARDKRGGVYVRTGEAYTSVGRNADKPEEMLDPEDDVEVASDAQLRLCSTLAQQQKVLIEEVDALERQLAAKQAALKTNMEADLPAAMAVAGLDEFSITGGHKVKLEKAVRASIPIAHTAEGLAYMMKHAPDLVKHVVTVEFAMNESKFFKKFLVDLKRRKAEVNAASKDYVHPSTLAKFVRDCDAEDKPVPEDILGVHRQKFAKVHLPKMGKEDI